MKRNFMLPGIDRKFKSHRANYELKSEIMQE